MTETEWDEYAAFNKRLRALPREEKIKFFREKFGDSFPHQEAIRDFMVFTNYGDDRRDQFPTVLVFHLPSMLYQGFDVPLEKYDELIEYFRRHPEGDKSLAESILLAY